MRTFAIAALLAACAVAAASEPPTWVDTFGDVHTSDGTTWHRDAFGNWRSDDGTICWETAFGEWRCEKDNE